MADLDTKLVTNYEMHYDYDTEKDLKKGFFKKTFGIIAVQLMYTAFLCACCMASKEMKDFMLENFWLGIVSVICGLVCMVLPLCFKSLRHTVPNNYINLSLFVCSR